MTTLTCIAIDDEPLALGLVSTFIGQTPFLNLKGKFSSAVEALISINAGDIDVIFLDIQMPDLNGIELARVLEARANKPRVIFTTAYNQFALEGYKVEAIDYLLKPFNYEEFLKASQKALNYKQLVNKPAVAADAEDEYLFLKVEYQLVRVALADILYIEGLKDYVKVWLVTGGKPILSLTSLKSLEEKLPDHKFMRVHRSFIISLDQVNSITRGTVHIGGINIHVGEQYKGVFNQFISKWS